MLTAFAAAEVVDSGFFLVVVFPSSLPVVLSSFYVATVGTEGSAVVFTTGAVIVAAEKLMSVVTFWVVNGSFETLSFATLNAVVITVGIVISAAVVRT